MCPLLSKSLSFLCVLIRFCCIYACLLYGITNSTVTQQLCHNGVDLLRLLMYMDDLDQHLKNKYQAESLVPVQLFRI